FSSMASGANAQATNSGSFVWSDGSTITASASANSVTFRATGGYRFLTGTGTNGAALAPGATSWSVLSDRNAKKDFAPVDSQTVLEKLARVPVQSWRYNWEESGGTPHLGPTAQDFKAAFYPGRDDTSITTLEFDGVELAAIQGLNQKLEQKLQEKDAQVAHLEESIAELKQLVADLAQSKTR
ncbi:MAG TPA: tail fiber domain-containing protein, partial [Verrucomicrobiae bacterium]|nr:tail fiber domain-containing protein [Verrucomicrobiae bacterium]